MDCTHALSSYFPPIANGTRECAECGEIMSAEDARHAQAVADAARDKDAHVATSDVEQQDALSNLAFGVNTCLSRQVAQQARIDALSADVSRLSTQVADLSSLSADIAALKAAENARVQAATETALKGAEPASDR